VRVAFFGAYDPDYPRNVVLRESLEAHGVEVRAIAVPPGTNAPVREARLLAGAASGLQGAHAILVPSFGHRDVPLATILGRTTGTPVLFDPLVSRWDTQVGDLGRVPARSISAARLRASDRMALSLPDLVLCDTWEHGDLYAREYKIARPKLRRIPVGADREAFQAGERRAARSRPPGGPLEIVYVGGFLPLHGVSTITAAAALLEARHGPRFARFTLIGGGMTAAEAERDIAALGLRSVRRVRRVAYAEALDALVRADLALGIFGTTAKAGRVIPHKVYQALAVGAPVVTRRSTAIAELFRDEEHLVLVPPGDPAALASAIEALASSPERRIAIGARGRAAVQKQASPEPIGALLLEAIAGAREVSSPKRRR